MKLILRILQIDTEEVLDFVDYSQDKTLGIVSALFQKLEVFPKIYYIDFINLTLLGSFVIDIQTSI